MIVSADTNLLVYAVDDRPTGKQPAARAALVALAARRSPLSLQVIGEFQNALRRRLKVPAMVASGQARNLLVAFDAFPYERSAVDSALTRSAAGLLGYWDALLVAACEAAGVDVLLSEDMQDGARFGRLTIVNPFGPDGALGERAREILEL